MGRILRDIRPKPIYTIAVASDQFNSDLKAMTKGVSGVYVTFKDERKFEAFAVINQINRLGIPYRVQNDYSFLHTSKAQKHEPELSIEVCGDSGPVLPHPWNLLGGLQSMPHHFTTYRASTPFTLTLLNTRRSPLNVVLGCQRRADAIVAFVNTDKTTHIRRARKRHCPCGRQCQFDRDAIFDTRIRCDPCRRLMYAIWGIHSARSVLRAKEHASPGEAGYASPLRNVALSTDLGS